jgi:hypothetical protein
MGSRETAPGERLRWEGDPEGEPRVGFDAERRQNYHLNGVGERVYHETPVGFAFDESGRLRATAAGEAEGTQGT